MPETEILQREIQDWKTLEWAEQKQFSLLNLMVIEIEQQIHERLNFAFNPDKDFLVDILNKITDTRRAIKNVK